MNEPTIKDKNYTFAQKLEYFWMYYKIHTIAVVAVVIVLGSILKSWVFQKDLVLLVSAFDTGNTEVTSIKEDFMLYADIDEKHEDVIVQHDGSLVGADQYAIANNMKIVAQVNSGELDVLITLNDKFDEYANSGCYKDLRDVFTDEELTAFGELVTDGQGIPVGIKTSNLKGLTKYGFYQHSYEGLEGVLGIVSSSQRPENAKKFINFLMEN